jgi:hypothetical protein
MWSTYSITETAASSGSKQNIFSHARRRLPSKQLKRFLKMVLTYSYVTHVFWEGISLFSFLKLFGGSED